MDYDLYHDESKEGGYWHGMLLIPRKNRDVFLNYLKEIRKTTKYQQPIHFKQLKDKGKKFQCIKSWIGLGVASLMQHYKNDAYIVAVNNSKYYSEELGLRTSYKEIIKMDSDDKIIGAKFILFKDRHDHEKMGDNYPDFTSKIETTFRMGMVGGVHWLGDEENPIEIKSIHFDGHEHYRRRINKNRIIGRIKSLRDYCSIEHDIDVDDRSSKHNRGDCQEYDDCQFLQLVDLFISGFRTTLGEKKNEIQKEVSAPFKKLVDKWYDGSKRMEKSRWHKGFWLSECWIENEKWRFGNFNFQGTNKLRLKI